MRFASHNKCICQIICEFWFKNQRLLMLVKAYIRVTALPYSVFDPLWPQRLGIYVDTEACVFVLTIIVSDV